MILGSRNSSFGDLIGAFCEVQGGTTAKREDRCVDIFPLPLPSKDRVLEIREKSDCREMWLFLLVAGLNYLNGGKHAGMQAFEPSGIQSKILEFLRGRVDRFLDQSFRIEVFDWASFLKTRSLSYTGEEVRSAKWTNWSHIAPALPRGCVGSIPVLDLAEEGIHAYLAKPELFLRPDWESSPVPSSRAMVSDEDWGDMARGLIEYNLCAILPQSALVKAGGLCILNGLFGVEKGEQHEGVEVHRLIMNLVPSNALFLPVRGDVDTLPLLPQMNALELQPSEELVISSEDIRAMFYIFALPPVWYPYLAFNRAVPDDVVPPGVDEPCFLCSKVLPMGFLNSVGVAQHLHRNFLRRVQGDPSNLLSYSEIRRDRTWSLANPKWRVYLDNLDVLHSIDPGLISVLEGQVSDDMSPLLTAYHAAGIPLNEKKSIRQASTAEIQGAEINGKTGLARPKPDKLGKYASAAVSLLRRRRCTQKEIQVVSGGLVYFAMFRRPLMSCLNYVWRFIQSFDEPGPCSRKLPSPVASELCMFSSLLPLAHQDYRASISGLCTASDASLSGGGLCASDGLTSFGEQVAKGDFRGQIHRDLPHRSVVCIGLFDGVASLRVALEALKTHVLLHVSVQCSDAAQRIVETHFPDSVRLDAVESITSDMCQEWAGRASACSLVIVGAGVPLRLHGTVNDREPVTSLHALVQPVIAKLRQHFCWCPVHFIEESAFNMEIRQRALYTRDAGVLPCRICASEITPCRRERLYWIDWALEAEAGCTLRPAIDKSETGYTEVHFSIDKSFVGIFEPGWAFFEGIEFLGAFTTAQPSSAPGANPAGLNKCSYEAKERWHNDRHRFPPYQYRDENLLWHPRHGGRMSTAAERERAMGLPRDFTFNCLPKNEIKSDRLKHDDTRMSLIGCAWSVPVVSWLLLHLLRPLGLCMVANLSELLDLFFRDAPILSDALLHWRSFCIPGKVSDPSLEVSLTRKLLTLLSIKGEDILIQVSSESRVPQKFRNTIPANLWRWRTICGWSWANRAEHINRLELRAVYSSLRWRVLRNKSLRIKFVHLTDSLVSLHVINRGRSSSHKIQSLMYRIASLSLAAGLHPFICYVSTHQNPADKPSRRARVRRKWAK